MNIFKKYNETAVIYSGDGKGGLETLERWVNIFFLKNINFAVVIRNKELYLNFKKKYRILNVLFSSSAQDVDQTLHSFQYLKTIFFVSHAGNNIHPLAFVNYQHIFLSSPMYELNNKVTKMLRGYDEIWISSERFKRRIEERFVIDNLIVKVIGNLFINSEEIQKKERLQLLIDFEKIIPNYKDVLNILNYISRFNIDVEITSNIHESLKLQIIEYSLINQINLKILNKEKPTNKYYDFVICFSRKNFSEFDFYFSRLFILNPLGLYKNTLSVDLDLNLTSESQNFLENYVNDDYLSAKRKNALEYNLGLDALDKRVFDKEVVNYI